jgi:hypothetical protein
MKGMVMTMKMSIPILILFVFTQLAFGQGGKHHKDTTYDYHDLTNSNIKSKTFNRYQGDPDNPIIEKWNFDRSVPGQVVRTEVRNDGGCMINKFQLTPSAFTWTHNNACVLVDFNYDPPVVDETIVREYDPPVTGLTSMMIPGIAWGSGAVMTETPGSERYYVDKNEVLAVENVSVPFGNYTGCLKIHRLRQVSSSPYTRIDWICPDIGLVKRVQGGSRMMELTDVTYVE